MDPLNALNFCEWLSLQSPRLRWYRIFCATFTGHQGIGNINNRDSAFIFRFPFMFMHYFTFLLPSFFPLLSDSSFGSGFSHNMECTTDGWYHFPDLLSNNMVSESNLHAVIFTPLHLFLYYFHSFHYPIYPDIDCLDVSHHLCIVF